MNRLENKVCLVTGGASGLGRQSVQLFAKEGAKIVIADLDAAGAEETVASLDGAETLVVEGDITQPEFAQRMVAEAVERFGSLDVLFNNAGIDGEVAATHEATESNWDRVLDVNLKAVFLGMKYGIGQMLKQDAGGSIINVSSCVAEQGWAGIPAYTAAKAGVIGLTVSAAVEYGGQNIRVNAIKPGLMLTELSRRANEEREAGGTIQGEENVDPLVRLGKQSPMGRGAEPVEVGQAALFLATDEAAYVNGAIIPVDGGWTSKLSESI